jgi:hypothetical protein
MKRLFWALISASLLAASASGATLVACFFFPPQYVTESNIVAIVSVISTMTGALMASAISAGTSAMSSQLNAGSMTEAARLNAEAVAASAKIAAESAGKRLRIERALNGYAANLEGVTPVVPMNTTDAQKALLALMRLESFASADVRAAAKPMRDHLMTLADIERVTRHADGRHNKDNPPQTDKAMIIGRISEELRDQIFPTLHKAVMKDHDLLIRAASELDEKVSHG